MTFSLRWFTRHVFITLSVSLFVVGAPFVSAQQRSAPAPTTNKVCHFDCIESHNIWTGTQTAPGPGRGQPCQCLGSGIRPVRPQTLTGDHAVACVQDEECRAVCQSICGTTGATCFMGTTPAAANCTMISPVPGCSPVGSGVGSGGTLHGSSPSCATIAAPGAAGRTGSGSNSGSGTRSRRPTSMVLHNPLGEGSTFVSIISRIIKGVIGIVGSLALLMFIYGGMRWMTAGGNEEGVKEAKTIIRNATIGLFLIFFSYTLISVFLSAFNLPRETPASDVPSAPPTTSNLPP